MLHQVGGGKLPPVLALVDSGADSSLFPIDIATPLGVNLGTCAVEDFMTAGGDSKQFRASTPIQAEMMGHNLNLNPCFAPGLPVILLGRDDFFSVFKVSFDERKRRFSLTPY